MVISKDFSALPLFNPSSKTQALQIVLLLTKPHLVHVLFSGAFTSPSIFNYSAECIISTIEEGLTFSKSIIF